MLLSGIAQFSILSGKKQAATERSVVIITYPLHVNYQHDLIVI